MWNCSSSYICKTKNAGKDGYKNNTAECVSCDHCFCQHALCCIYMPTVDVCKEHPNSNTAMGKPWPLFLSLDAVPTPVVTKVKGTAVGKPWPLFLSLDAVPTPVVTKVKGTAVGKPWPLFLSLDAVPTPVATEASAKKGMAAILCGVQPLTVAVTMCWVVYI